MSKLTQEKFDEAYAKHQLWLNGYEGGEFLDLSYKDLTEIVFAAFANLDRANLCGANLDGANLRGANLRGANLDVYQKWNVTWHIDGIISIGCKTKTIAEWDAWFSGSETYETQRGTADFERIEAAYQHAKRMYEIWEKYEKQETK